MGRWTRGRTVGRGSSATVSMAFSSSSGEVFAVKSAEMSRSESLQREQKILSSISSPHIVSYKGWDVIVDGTELVYNLFMEYCPCGTLRDAIDRCGGWLGEAEITRYTRQILIGLEHLHCLGIVHCDVKPRNILITEEGAKISDFGCAKRVEDLAGPTVGTPMFMAPEVARGEGQGQPADVWALGCTVIEMATGKAPWPESGDPFSVMYRVAYSAASPDIPSCLSDEAKDFLTKCLRKDPSERWTVTQLLKHPFLARLNSPVSKQCEELKSSSPTCVLDHGFWSSSSEELDHDTVDPEQTVLVNSAADRIGQLSSSSGRPDWTWKEDWGHWTTVRGHFDELNRQLSGTLCGSDGGPIGLSNMEGLEITVISRDGCKKFSKGCKYREGGDVISSAHAGQHGGNSVTLIPKL
ncbi:hypothetical protein CDL15_Pgr023221 [Punica granatum]|uniref:Protein kinase domain-containing protein n=1 Tax=Punica granatum TaxID=22663 RepID=A0A218X4Z9_PUNGR|nr:hypothetical protein CDL15_Pgr023221 [Punica granatum]PKI41954.1 hypothetical protein CRG98_037637 [Punica granatum]